MNNFKISCVVPVYNTEKYLYKCIKSILEQTYKDLELILIDDGSTDKSGLICDEFAEIDNRVKVIHQKNAGVSVARNVGIKEATGDYICFIDSDDYVDNDYFELAIPYIEKYKPNLFINNHIKDNKRILKREFQIFTLDNFKAIDEMFKKKYYSWEPVACFYKCSICKKNLFCENIRYGEDLLFKYQFIKDCDNNILYAALEKYHYVFRIDSACNSYNLSKKIDDLKVLHFIIEKESNDLGKRVYYNEYLPRLIKYYKVGLRCKSEQEKKSLAFLKKYAKEDLSKIYTDDKIKISLKVKVVLLKILEWIYA